MENWKQKKPMDSDWGYSFDGIERLVQCQKIIWWGLFWGDCVMREQTRIQRIIWSGLGADKHEPSGYHGLSIVNKMWNGTLSNI